MKLHQQLKFRIFESPRRQIAIVLETKILPFLSLSSSYDDNKRAAGHTVITSQHLTKDNLKTNFETKLKLYK